jgi:DNA-binding NarL/FixJ family response regulator
MARKHILLVEDSAIFAAGLTKMLSAKVFNVKTVLSQDLHDFIAEKRDIGSDLVVIDAVTWSGEPSVLLESIAYIGPRLPLLILGNDDFVDVHLGLLYSRLAGFVRQTVDGRTLNTAVRAMLGGALWLDRAAFQRLVDPLYRSPQALSTALVKERNLEILRLLIEGNTNKQIGAKLGCSERTVKADISALLRLTGTSTRSALGSYAITHGLATVGGG